MYVLFCTAVTSFLHENYLNFIGEDALEDMIEAAGYFSDAGKPLLTSTCFVCTGLLALGMLR